MDTMDFGYQKYRFMIIMIVREGTSLVTNIPLCALILVVQETQGKHRYLGVSR